jgi:large subunit ribosomal protein L10
LKNPEVLGSTASKPLRKIIFQKFKILIMLQKSKKEEMLRELEGAIKGSESLVFVNFHGMKVNDETILRRNLRDQGVSYKVWRKTLLARALEGKAEGVIPELAGEVAIAYSKDTIASPREIYNFQKTHKGILSIIGGIFEGKFVGAPKMIEIGMIPSREVLYAQFVNLINSPIQRFAVVLNEIAKSK